MTTEEEKLVTDNINLAYDIMWRYYAKVKYLIDLDDLKSICLLGLVKASKTFNKSLGNTFSTYAYTVIQNDILLNLRENKQKTSVISFYDKTLDNLELYDTIQDDFNLFDYVENNLNKLKLLTEIEKLPDKYKTIIKYRLQGLSMTEIGNIIGKSQPQISHDLNKIINILRKKFDIGKEV